MMNGSDSGSIQSYRIFTAGRWPIFRKPANRKPAAGDPRRAVLGARPTSQRQTKTAPGGAHRAKGKHEMGAQLPEGGRGSKAVSPDDAGEHGRPGIGHL